jgi:hypothetical protein
MSVARCDSFTIQHELLQPFSWELLEHSPSGYPTFEATLANFYCSVMHPVARNVKL